MKFIGIRQMGNYYWNTPNGQLLLEYAKWATTVKSSNFVSGHYFRHPKGKFFTSPAEFIAQDNKKFQKQTPL